MRSLSMRMLIALSILLVPTFAFASVTINGTNSFASLDGGPDDADHTANGVFTVNGDLIINGTINCNDTGGSSSACPMAFNVSGDMTINAGGALYAEDRSGSGTGGAITISVGGNFVMHSATSTLAAAIISSDAKSSSSSTGGAITASVSGTVSIESGATIDAGAVNAAGGKITLLAGGHLDVSGNVFSGPSRTVLATVQTGLALDGGTGNQSGGEIYIQGTSYTEPGVTIGSTANIISQGQTNGSGPVTIEGCGVVVKGLVAALAMKDYNARVDIRSGKSVTVDARDLGVANATLGRNGHIRVDAPTGAADHHTLDIYAGTTVTINGPDPAASSLFALSGLPGVNTSKSDGAAMHIMAVGGVLTGTVTGSGNMIDDGRITSGDGGGHVEISAQGNIGLDTARILAIGDSNTNNTNRNGGSIAIRSYSGNIVWTNGVGNVTPTGSDVPTLQRGSISLTACGTINTSGSSFPTNGSPVGTFPATTTGSCSPATPSLPVTETALPVCNNPPVADNISATTNEDNAVTITMTATDPDGDSLTFTIVTPPAHGSLGAIFNPTPNSAQVTYTPNANYNGSDSFTFQADDGKGGTSIGTVTITINPVNDPPTFNLGANPVSSNEDAGPQTIANYASSISPGPTADESTQTVTFTVTNDNNALFSAQPAISSNGTLTYTSAPNANGSANITVVAHDNGGTANGGNDTSSTHNFNIVINAVNDAPSFTKGADQTVLEDSGAHSVSGWATGISAGPADESSQTVTFNVNNTNNALFSAQPAVASNGTLTFTGAPNANGTATVTVVAHDDGGTANGGVDNSAPQTFTITVVAVNDAPSFTKGSDVTVLEDSGAYSQSGWATAISAGPADEAGQTVHFNVTNNTNSALFSAQPAVANDGTLTFTTAANANGSATITINAQDNGGTANGGVDTSASQTFVINVTAVNDAPSFTKGADQTSAEDAGPQTVAGWATAISAGPADESSQTVTFNVSNDNNALFSVQPAVASDGTLTYTAAANATGVATVTVAAHDDGGTANGGVDTSASQTFTITITAVNDPPSFTKGPDQTVLEDSGAHTVNNWATAISAGPADESSQTVTFTATNDNNALFSAQPAVASDGTLTFTSAPDANGTSTVTVTAHDDGGTAGGGNDTSAPQTFTITVTAVNDAPSFTKGANQTSLEDAGPQTVSGWATAISAGPANESSQSVNFIVSNDNNGLFSSQPAVASNGTLTYTAAPNANGVATVTVAAHDNGGTANGGVDTSASQTFTITITAVNDPPSFTKGADPTVLEDSGAHSVTPWATSISAGPADESSQTVSFTTSNDNNALFSSQPSVDASGNLTFTSAPDANGTATVTVTAHDNGGTANGGVDTSAPQTFTITVTAVNDAPSFTKGADQTSLEDGGPQTVAGWATAISAGPADESSQVVTFNVSNDNNALFSSQPAVASNGTLTYTAAPNANGIATVTVAAHDDGGTANGGVDTSASQTFTITITAVNDAPSFTKGPDQTVLEDSGAHTVTPWATSISAGPADESSQTVSFTATNDNNTLFSSQPAVDASGNLTFTVAPDANGTATVSVTAHDDGGTANGGVDTSAPQTFTITVTAVNDAPSFTKGPDESVFSDAGPQTYANWATAISAGPANESAQTVSFIVNNDNNAAFTAQPAVSSSGTLTFNTAVSAPTTTVHVTVTAHDNGGTANGGVDTSAPQTFNINVTHANQPPVANPDAYDAVGNTELAVGTAGTQAATLTVASGSVLANDTDSDGDPLTATLGSASAGATVTMNSDGSFRYLPAAGFSGDDSFTYVVSDGHGHNVTGTVTIHVTKRVLYVKNNGGGSTGRVDSPYTTLASAQAAAADNDTVYVFTGDGTITGQSNGITLSHNGERLVGEGAALKASGVYNGATNPQLRAAGTAPKMSNSAGAGVTITGAGTLSNNEVSGVEITSATNAGVSIGNAANVTMDHDKIDASTNSGVRGTSVNGFSFTNGSILSSGSASGDANMSFDSLTGSATVSNSTFAGAFTDNIRIANTGGALNRIAFDHVTLNGNSATTGNNGINLVGSGSAVMNVSVTNSNFNAVRSVHFQVSLSGSGSTDVVFDHNTVANGQAVVAGGGGIALTTGGAGSTVAMTYAITNNSFTGANGNAITVSKGVGTGGASGTVDNNSVGVQTSANSGAASGSGVAVVHVGGGTSTTSITNNRVYQYNSTGIMLQIGDNTSGGNGNMVATVTGNTISNPGAFAANGFLLNAGTTTGDQHTVCLTLGGSGPLANAMTGSGPSADFRLRQRMATTVKLPGYAGANNDNAAVTSFVQGKNGGTPSGSVANTVPTGGGFIGGTCP